MNEKHGGDYCEQGQRIVSLEEKVRTLFEYTDKLERTLEKLDDTQDKLREEIAKLNKTITTLQWVIVVAISALAAARTLGII